MRFRERIRKPLKASSDLGPIVSGVAILVGMAGFIGVTGVLVNKLQSFQASGVRLWDVEALGSILGLGFLLLLLLRSVIGDFYTVFFHDRQIICGRGQSGSEYDYTRVLDSKTKQLIITGQNLFYLINKSSFLEDIADHLDEKPKANVTIVLTLPGVFKALGDDIGLADYVQSIKQLRKSCGERLKKHVGNSFIVSFHAAASSLSAMFRDPDHRSRSLVVFTPKWAVDVPEGGRLYCVIHRWEHDDFFQTIWQNVGNMIKQKSRKPTLEDICTELDIQ